MQLSVVRYSMVESSYAISDSIFNGAMGLPGFSVEVPDV